MEGKIGGDDGVPAGDSRVVRSEEGGNGRAAKEGKNRGKEIAVEKELAVAGEAEKEGLEEAEEVCEEVGGGGGIDPFVNQPDGECKR